MKYYKAEVWCLVCNLMCYMDFLTDKYPMDKYLQDASQLAKALLA